MKRKRKSAGRMASKGFPNPIDVHVGGRIRSRRTVMGLSQSALAEAIGLTFQQVQKYESGANRVSSSRLFDVSRVLDVPIVFFFSEMPDDTEQNSPAQLQGAKPPAVDRGTDPMHSRETLELVRAYYQIKEPAVRKRLSDIVRAISKSAPD